MPIYLYTVESSFGDAYATALERGIRMSEMSGRAEFKTLIQGIPLELRFPDGTNKRTHLMNYGVGVVKQADG